MSEIRDLLVASRASHAEYRRLDRLPGAETARKRAALIAAQTSRLAAADLDPHREDAEWSCDTVPSETLVAFYVDWLNRHSA